MLTRNKNTLRISASDWYNGYLVTKFKPGENIDISVEADSACGEVLVISANKTQGRRVLFVNSDTVVDPTVYLVVVDASQNHVQVTLPVAHDYLGQLSIVCADGTNGISIIPNGSTQNIIFDESNIALNVKGDSITLVSDRGQSEPLPPNESELENTDILSVSDVICPGTWYCVGRYCSNWYA